MNRSRRDCRIRNGGRGHSIGEAKRRSAGTGRPRACPPRISHRLFRFAQSRGRGRCNAGGVSTRTPARKKAGCGQGPESVAGNDRLARGCRAPEEYGRGSRGSRGTRRDTRIPRLRGGSHSSGAGAECGAGAADFRLADPTAGRAGALDLGGNRTARSGLDARNQRGGRTFPIISRTGDSARKAFGLDWAKDITMDPLERERDRDVERGLDDRRLESALIQFGKAEPRVGLENRLLANLRAERAPAYLRRRWWRALGMVASLAAILVAVRGWGKGRGKKAKEGAAASPTNTRTAHEIVLTSTPPPLVHP